MRVLIRNIRQAPLTETLSLLILNAKSGDYCKLGGITARPGLDEFSTAIRRTRSKVWRIQGIYAISGIFRKFPVNTRVVSLEKPILHTFDRVLRRCSFIMSSAGRISSMRPIMGLDFEEMAARQPLYGEKKRH